MTHPRIQSALDRLPPGSSRMALRAVAIVAGILLWISAVIGAGIGFITWVFRSGVTHAQQSGFLVTVVLFSVAGGAAGALLVWWGMLRETGTTNRIEPPT